MGLSCEAWNWRKEEGCWVTGTQVGLTNQVMSRVNQVNKKARLLDICKGMKALNICKGFLFLVFDV